MTGKIKAEMATWSREGLVAALLVYVEALDNVCAERDALRRELDHTTDELAAEMVNALYHEGSWH